MAPENTGTLGKVTRTLEDIDKAVGSFIPMIGTMSKAARLSISTTRILIRLLRSRGEDVATFEQEINALDGEIAGLDAKTDAFRAQFGYAPGTGPAPPATT